jgi:hypothetical protein
VLALGSPPYQCQPPIFKKITGKYAWNSKQLQFATLVTGIVLDEDGVSNMKEMLGYMHQLGMSVTTIDLIDKSITKPAIESIRQQLPFTNELRTEDFEGDKYKQAVPAMIEKYGARHTLSPLPKANLNKI